MGVSGGSESKRMGAGEASATPRHEALPELVHGDDEATRSAICQWCVEGPLANVHPPPWCTPNST